jgi:hypothetical protein
MVDREYLDDIRVNSRTVLRQVLETRNGRSGDQNPVGTRFFPPIQTGPGAHPDFYTMGTGRGVALTTHPHLAPKLKKE